MPDVTCPECETTRYVSPSEDSVDCYACGHVFTAASNVAKKNVQSNASRGSGIVPMIGVGVGGLIIGFLLGMLCMAVILRELGKPQGQGPQSANSAKSPAARLPGVLKREEFREALKGRTKDEVLIMLGRPLSTNDSDADSWWRYQSLTMDAVTGQIDRRITIWFKNGIVHDFLLTP